MTTNLNSLPPWGSGWLIKGEGATLAAKTTDGAFPADAVLRVGGLEVEPTIAEDTATWSLTTLQRALRQAPDGLPQVSTYAILTVLHEAGFTWQASRTWCETGKVKRKRKAGVVEVTDPNTAPKKS